MTIAPTDLRAILDEYSSNMLISMASFLGLALPKQRNKQVIIGLIIQRITDPQAVQQTVNQLSASTRALLDAILRREGQAPLRSLRAELSNRRLIDPKARVEFGEYSYKDRPDPRADTSRRLEDLLAALVIRGLVFPQEVLSEDSYQTKRTVYDATSQVFIPPAILALLPVPTPLAEPVEKIPEITRIQEGSGRVFQRDLYLYWSYVRDRRPSLTQRGELLKGALKDINNLLLERVEISTGQTENDHPRLRFLRGMLAALKLAQEDRTGHVLPGPSSTFFEQPPDARVQKTFETWLSTEQFSELLLLPPGVRPRSTSNPLIPARPLLVRARKFVVEQLRKMAASVEGPGWFSLEGLVSRVYERDYEFFLRRPKTSRYYYSTPLHPYDYSSNEMGLTFPGILREEDGWQQVEANLIRGVVTGPLFWMGLVDLGWGQGDVPVTFRLTALGQWLLGRGPRPEIPVEGGRVIVQPNLHIMALDPILDSVLATLDQFAERLSAERAVEYRLTRASVYAGQLAGWDSGRIKESLEKMTQVELPANVARTLDEWQAQFERITIRPHVALVHGDPQLVSQLAEEKATRALIAARPVEGLAVLKNASGLEQISKQLTARGVWPVINKKPVAPAGSITCTADGLVRLATRTPSLYLHGYLAAFADPHDDHYQITHGSVQRAIRGGLTAPQIIERLQAIHAGPLPDQLPVKIRTWSQHYGSARLAPVTVLQLRDAQTLDELLEDPEIGPLLKRFAPRRPDALAQVAPENVEKLRALLAERGVDLSDRLE